MKNKLMLLAYIIASNCAIAQTADKILKANSKLKDTISDDEWFNKTINEGFKAFRHNLYVADSTTVEALIADKQYKKALEKCDTAIHFEYKHEIFYHKALCYHLLNDYQKSQTELVNAVEFGVNNPLFIYKIYYLSLYNKIAMGYPKEANDLIDKILNNTNYTVSKVKLKELLQLKLNNFVKLEDYNNAYITISEYIKQGNTTVEAYNQQGLIAYELKKYEDAIVAFNQCIKKNEDATVRYYRALCYLALNNADYACVDIKIAKEAGIKQADDLFNKHCKK